LDEVPKKKKKKKKTHMLCVSFFFFVCVCAAVVKQTRGTHTHRERKRKRQRRPSFCVAVFPVRQQSLDMEYPTKKIRFYNFSPLRRLLVFVLKN
jgi:hypothetical protein